MLHKSRKISAVVALAILVSAPAAAVCRVPQPRLVCAEYFHEQLVVVAKLVRSTYVTTGHDLDGHEYELRTARVLRGKIGPTFNIWEENSSGRAGFAWKTGRSYVLFLSYSKRDQAWSLDGCGNSGPTGQAGRVLEEVQQLRAGKSGGVIEGHVYRYEAIAGVKILVRGDGRRFETVTNRKGEFKIRVPAGQYIASASLDKMSFVGDDFSYEDPQNIAIENGGCAQLEFTR